MVTQGQKIAIAILVVAAIIGLILLISKKEKNKKNSCESNDDCGTNETCAENVCICPDTNFTVYDGKCLQNCESPQQQLPDCNTCISDNLKAPECTECVNTALKAPECNECVNPLLQFPECTTCVNPLLQSPQCTACVNPDLKAPECTEKVDCKLSMACQGSKTLLKTLIAAVLKSSPDKITAANAIIDRFVNDDCCNPAADKQYCLCPNSGCSVIFDELKKVGIDLEELAPNKCNRTFDYCCKLTG